MVLSQPQQNIVGTFGDVEEVAIPQEEQPLLPKASTGGEDAVWVKPDGFFWIEVAIFTNVFLAGFDGTVTASTYAVISSEFMSSNLASWITTSYLVTSTALQPLYGRFSDIFGRRICLFVATTLFGLGCLGCSLSPDLVTLNLMRALTGIGGGGLMTMATIINSDMIPMKQRGMYQAVQNVLHGFGAICGASLGGVICDAIGWRFCFLLQVPISVAALIIAKVAVPKKLKKHDAGQQQVEPATRSAWEQVDLSGALLLIVGLSLQLAAMSMGGNGLSWSSPSVLRCLIPSVLLLGGFFAVESRTKAIPLMPLALLKSVDKAALLLINICLGITGYGFLFLMPLFFQSVLLDSASVAGLRLVAPSLATPIGGLATGLMMRHGDRLGLLTRAGLAILVVGAWFNLKLGMQDQLWKYSVYLMVGSFGQGVSYPASLFAFIRACEHREHAVATSMVYLVRSMGSVWGVASVSTVTQTVLSLKLSEAFSGKPDGAEIIEALEHSVEALRDLPPESRQVAQAIYYDACRAGFYFLLSVNVVSAALSLLVSRRRRSPNNAVQ